MKSTDLQENLTNPNSKPSRKTYLGGADVACVLGCGFKTAFELWQQKCGFKDAEDLSEVVRVRVGSELEQYVLADYEKRFSCKLSSKQEFRRSCHKNWAGGTVDALDEARIAVVDAKVHFGYAFDNDKLPTKYVLQALWYCYVFEIPRAYFHVLHLHASGFRTYEVNFYEHEEFFEGVIDKCEEFWRCVQEREPPKHTPDDTTAPYILAFERKLHGLSTKTEQSDAVRYASADEMQALDDLKSIKEEQKALDERKAEVQSKLTNAFAVAEVEVANPSCRLLDVFSDETLCKIVRKKESNEFLRFSY